MRLDEPLWLRGPNTRKLARLCVRVTLACERAARHSTPSPFDGPAGMRIHDAFATLCDPGVTPLQTLRDTGLLAMFPHLEGLAQAGARHQQHRRRHSPGWEYFEHISATLSLRRVSAQLAKDGGRPENAKYVAHQIALLYQCANAARREGKALRRRIEERFEEVKGETEGGGALSEESRAWLAETAAEGEALTTPRGGGRAEKLRPLLRALKSGG